jgi:hypothetical protein
MRTAPPLCLFGLAALTLTACATSSQPSSASPPPAATDTSDAPALLYSSLTSRATATEAAGAESMFGEWTSQIIRHSQVGKQGPPWVYEGGQYFDAERNENRPKLDLTLAEDGTYALIANYGPAPTARTFVFGTWSWNGARVLLTQDGEVTWDFVYRGGKLIADKKEDNTSIILGRR